MRKSRLKKRTVSLTKEPAMLNLHETFLTDEKGRKKAVVIDLEEYRKLLSCLEDAYDTRLIKKRMKSPSVSTQEFRKLLDQDARL